MLSKIKGENNLQNGRKHLQIKYLIGVNTQNIYKEFTQFNRKKKENKQKWFTTGQRNWIDIFQRRHTNSQRYM